MSRLRRYKALSIDACMHAARRDFGADAVIHAVRSRREGFAWRRRTVHELLAGPASSLQSIAAAGHNARAPRSRAAVRTMAADSSGSAFSTSSTAPASDALLRCELARQAYATAADASTPIVLDLDRRRTQLLAQAMAIRLERDERARRLAQTTERASTAAGGPGADAGAEAGAAGIECRAPRASGESKPSIESSIARVPDPEVAARFVLVPAGRATEHADGSVAPFGAPGVLRTMEGAPGVLRTAEGAPGVLTALSADVRSLRALVERVLSSRVRGNDAAVAEELLSTPAPWCDAIDEHSAGAPLAGFYATLIGHSMAAELARRIIEEARESLSPADRLDPALARAAVLARVAALLPPCEHSTLQPRAGARPHVISLVGPTGTGKTTTIAKLAAGYALRQHLRVGLVTTDTFRIAAVEQLRTYADIVGIPLEVAEGESGVRSACERLRDRDVILVDTAGRGHADRERVEELSRLVRAAKPDETHLVLSSTGHGGTLVAQAEAFACVGVHRVVIAKLDEAVGFGVLLGALGKIGRPVSWLTTGQQVPDDIEPARRDRLAELVLACRGGVAA